MARRKWKTGKSDSSRDRMRGRQTNKTKQNFETYPKTNKKKCNGERQKKDLKDEKKKDNRTKTTPGD